MLLLPFYWMTITTFRPDGESSTDRGSPSTTRRFWTDNPTFEHVLYLFAETSFARWMFNTKPIAPAAAVA